MTAATQPARSKVQPLPVVFYCKVADLVIPLHFEKGAVSTGHPRYPSLPGFSPHSKPHLPAIFCHHSLSEETDLEQLAAHLVQGHIAKDRPSWDAHLS